MSLVSPPYLYALALAVGFGGGYWSKDLQDDRDNLATRVEVQERVVTKVVVDRAETERIRGEYLEFKQNALEEIDRYKHRVAELGGLHVNAQCVPAAGATASGIAAGTARLTPEAEEDYFSYERAYSEQLSLFRMCRDELIKRSSK